MILPIALLLLKSLTANATPLPDLDCAECVDRDEYSITNTFDWKGPFQLIYGPSCEGVPGAPCQLQQGHEYSTGVSVEIGVELGLDFKKIFSGGIGASVALEESRAVNTAVTVTCPDYVQCGFIHQDAIRVVQGYKKSVRDCSANAGFCEHGVYELSNNFYEVFFPKLGDNGFPVAEIMPCACPDGDLSKKPHGMYICPRNCA
jgi:hypothetical protein